MAGRTIRQGTASAWIAALIVLLMAGCAAEQSGRVVVAEDVEEGSGGADSDSGEPARTSLSPGTDAASGAAPGGAGSVLERTRSGAASDLRRRVSQTLTRLDAQARGGDTVITLPDTVLFDFDEHELRPDAVATLDDIAEVIAYADPAPVRIHGHTDARGAAGYNQRLSERRADAVVAHLAGAGVSRARLSARGFGETRPVAPNQRDDGSDDPEGRARNRRVEVIIQGVDLTAP